MKRYRIKSATTTSSPSTTLMIENKQRQNRKSLLWKQICAFYTREKKEPWFRHENCVENVSLETMNFSFICGRRLYFDHVCKSQWWFMHTHTPPMTEIWWRFFFLRLCLSYLKAVDFINVSMAGKCNNRNCFSSAKLVFVCVL